MTTNFYTEQQQYDIINETALFLKEFVNKNGFTNFNPKILIICGSGLGGISNHLDSNSEKLIISYNDIPNFKKSTVPGHKGNLMLGYMNKTPIILMNGRLHSYEGYSLFDTTLPIRSMHEAFKPSLNNLIVTNAAGSLNKNYNSCDLMSIMDHINVPGLSGFHPLKGPNLNEYGPRFLPLSDAYDLNLRKLLFNTAKNLNLNRKIHEGTYCFVSGPTFETRAECRYLNSIGGDAVGMSTVPEVIVARHCGWKVAAISLITNNCVLDHPPSVFDENPIPLDEGIANHAEVLENGKLASKDVESLIFNFVGKINKL